MQAKHMLCFVVDSFFFIIVVTPIVNGSFVRTSLCNEVLCLLSSFAIISLGCFAFIVFLVLSGCYFL